MSRNLTLIAHRTEVLNLKRKITALEDALIKMADQGPLAKHHTAYWFIIQARKALGRDVNTNEHSNR